jgi:hypothetical protein
VSALAGKRVLPVEDEFRIARTAEEALRALGVRVLGPAFLRAEAIALATSDGGAGAVVVASKPVRPAGCSTSGAGAPAPAGARPAEPGTFASCPMPHPAARSGTSSTG